MRWRHASALAERRVRGRRVDDARGSACLYHWVRQMSWVFIRARLKAALRAPVWLNQRLPCMGGVSCADRPTTAAGVC